MDSPPPAPWTYAARAAYFGDRVCPFCGHHNPAGAKFCNDCSSPLYRKPCNECDAVNHQAATDCCPASFTTSEATPDDVGVASTVTQPLFAAGALRAGWRLVGIVTILIAGVYATYRIKGATPDAMGVASQPIVTGEHNAPIAASVVPVTVELKQVEPETTTALRAPNTNLEAPKRASPRQRPVPVPATKSTSTQQRPVHAVPVPVGATQSHAAAPVGVTEARKARQPDRWEAMHLSLASCGGDLIARILCDQRVRRRFCEGHWGEAPECGGLANDHGK